MDRVLHQPPLRVDQGEVDPPRVDGDRVDVTGLARSGPEAVEHVPVDAEDVPVERLPRAHGHVREAVDLGDAQALAVEPADRHPPALGAEIDGGERRHQPAASWFRTARLRSRGRSGGGCQGPGSTVMTLTPAARHASTSAAGALESVIDAGEILDRHEGEQGASVPLGAVEDPVHLLAGVRHLLLDAHLVRVEVHQAAREAQAPRAEEALVDPRRAKHVCAEVADERHRRQAQHPAGDEDGDPRSVGERGGDEQPVGDDDELTLRAQLEREVVRGRARVQRDRLAFADHGGRRARDRALLLDLEAQAQVEAGLGLVVLKRPDAAANAGDETLARELGQVAPHRHLRNGECLRKFRNRKVVPRLEQAEHVIQALRLRKVAKIVHPLDFATIRRSQS